MQSYTKAYYHACHALGFTETESYIILTVSILGFSLYYIYVAFF